MKKPLALIIDDEPDIRELLEITLERIKVDCICAGNLSDAKKSLTKNNFDICLTDMRLPDGNGLEFVDYCQRHFPSMPIAVLTAHGNMESAIQALKSGAFDFLSKPVDLNTLRTIVKNALNLDKVEDTTRHRLIGTSVQIQELVQTIIKVARSQAPICISGESGTGKELVANMIHAHSPRAHKPFIPINCGAIPNDLLESELFGHVKGSFTGAVSDKNGLFRSAEGGTLFLDEIAELPQHMQVKLLRSIQEKAIRPVGLQEEINIDVRILSATNKDLQKQVNAGQFRQDLYYRVNVINVRLPPLRERKQDIGALVDHLLQRIAAKELVACPEISKAALNHLQEYSFPGNVRELENILERAVAMCGEELIEKDDLNIQTEVNGDPLGENGNLDSVLMEVERKRILDALEKTGGNKTAAAKLLRISFRALRYRLAKLGLD